MKEEKEKMDVSKYMVDIEGHVNGGTCFGVGFMVDDLFITAGHVIEKLEDAKELNVEVNGNTYRLDKKNRIFFESMGNEERDPLQNDVAIYRINGVHSPLVLSEDFPEMNDSYSSFYFTETIENSGDETIPEIFRKSSTINLEESAATYEGIHEGNFFRCRMEKILQKGNSGCPLIKGNVVYGILHGGQIGGHQCVFQSAQSVLKIIEKIKTE